MEFKVALPPTPPPTVTLLDPRPFPIELLIAVPTLVAVVALHMAALRMWEESRVGRPATE